MIAASNTRTEKGVSPTKQRQTIQKSRGLLTVPVENESDNTDIDGDALDDGYDGFVDEENDETSNETGKSDDEGRPRCRFFFASARLSSTISQIQSNQHTGSFHSGLDSDQVKEGSRTSLSDARQSTSGRSIAEPQKTHSELRDAKEQKALDANIMKVWCSFPFVLLFFLTNAEEETEVAEHASRRLFSRFGGPNAIFLFGILRRQRFCKPETWRLYKLEGHRFCCFIQNTLPLWCPTPKLIVGNPFAHFLDSSIIFVGLSCSDFIPTSKYRCDTKPDSLLWSYGRTPVNSNTLPQCWLSLVYLSVEARIRSFLKTSFQVQSRGPGFSSYFYWATSWQMDTLIFPGSSRLSDSARNVVRGNENIFYWSRRLPMVVPRIEPLGLPRIGPPYKARRTWKAPNDIWAEDFKWAQKQHHTQG